MNSKEKRQLRNKISARNFRNASHPSKPISPHVIPSSSPSALNWAPPNQKNIALCQEIAAFKKTLLLQWSLFSRLAPSWPALSPPPEQKKKLAVANTQKDLPISPRIGARVFWGGASLGMGPIGSGITPVHMTFVPPMGSAGILSRKPENINPALNMPTSPSPPPILSPPPFTSPPVPGIGSGFDAFADMNPFTLMTLDTYRMQL